MLYIIYFSAVYTCKTDMLELDCQLTADGFVVVAHDDSLGRLCDVDKKIQQFNYKVRFFKYFYAIL